LKGFDYSTLAPQKIKIVPPESVINLWKEDYETMQRTMIYGESLSFNELINKIKMWQTCGVSAHKTMKWKTAISFTDSDYANARCTKKPPRNALAGRFTH
jgi:hypothetical protein